MTEYDVIVVGGGPAGLAFARALDGCGLSVAVVERGPLGDLADPADDGREIALTRRAVAALRRLGAWDRIDRDAIAPLRGAHVLNGGSAFALAFEPGTPDPVRPEPVEGRAIQSGLGGPLRASFDRLRTNGGKESGVGEDGSALGYMVANHHIRRALFGAVEGQPGLDLMTGASVVAAQRGQVTLGDGRVLTTRLLVAADSRFSGVRDQLGIAATVNRIGKSMLVCRVAHERDHGGVATEWFDHGQTIAMLPLNGRRSSAVLTLPGAEIERLAALEPQALGAELTRRYAGRLGAMQVQGRAHVYPLATTWAHHFAADGAALIGDAAVGMHPVTAHGFNLGLAGAMRLAGLVSGAAARGGDIAGGMLLRRYEAAHRVQCRPLYDATAMIVGLYTAQSVPARIARHVTLRAAARLPFVRQSVSRLLMQS